MASFRGERFFLSNFSPARVVLKGVEFPTVEHGFVYFKTLEPAERALVLLCTTPAEVKRLGRTLTLRDDWEEIKIPLMLELLRRKFQAPELAEKLLATGEEALVEVNEWHDTFWGICRGHGQNWLGRLLMQVRKELQNATKEDAGDAGQSAKQHQDAEGPA